jgi:hypothetical protein
MNVSIAKQRIEDALKAAEATLAGLGINVTSEIEVTGNELDGGEVDVLMILGSLAISADGLTEDDTYYDSIDIKVSGDEVDDNVLENAIAAFGKRVADIKAKLAGAEDPAEAVRAMGLAVDEELETKYREELAREHRAVKRDLKIAIFATAALLIVGLIFVIVSSIVK